MLTEPQLVFADVILPLPLPNTFTYQIPIQFNDLAKPGMRVLVKFGKKRILTAVIEKIHNLPPPSYQPKLILEFPDESPIINPTQLTLFRWMAEYYMCTLGEVVNAALPVGLKPSSKSRVQLNPHFDCEDIEFLSEKERIVFYLLQKNDSLSYTEIADSLGLKSGTPVIKSLAEKGVILFYEEIRDKYQPKIEKRIRLKEQYVSEKKELESLFAQLEKRPKQTDVLLAYLKHVSVLEHPEANLNGLSKKELESAGISSASLKTLIKKGVFEMFEVIKSRFPDIKPTAQEITLSPDQLSARNEIIKGFENKDIALLHGVTGSGKTEIYIDLIQQTLNKGKQVLYLLPEIALTAQIVNRLQKIFGDKVGVYHSKFSDNERTEVWKGVLSGTFKFILGVRSAVFLPFTNLGLVIVDEEHETSYKQHEPAPRYHARETAIMLAHFHQSKTLLGSATPALESYRNAREGRWALVELDKRYGNAVMPEILTADTLSEKKQKKMQAEFSSVLIQALTECLEAGEQAILFQNRRGYAPQLICEECAVIPYCTSCNVSMTCHTYTRDLRCHYCGKREPMPTVCTACGSTQLQIAGFGTQKLEDDLKLIFPDIRIQRMDLDTTRRKYAYQKIITDFEEHQVDVLIGTQMITKGLDFDRVSLVGIFDSDRMIHFPDFRAAEKAFGMLTQVSGRAGRREKKGKVIIQTTRPDQAVLRMVIENDYKGFVERELIEREKFNYPPFSRIITLIAKNKQKDIAGHTARELAGRLKSKIGQQRVLGPESPVIDKIRNYYLQEITIKLEREKVDLKKAKTLIKEVIQEVLTTSNFKSSRVIVDVDPA